MTDLPFIPVAEPDLSALEEQYVLEAVRSGWVSSIGAFIDRFERNFAAFCGVDHCVALSNGTVALHVALLAKGIGPGDEVIVPDLTFVATAAAVIHAGATPVLVDVDARTFALDVELTKAAVTERTRAVIPVHLYGQPAPIGALRSAVGPNVFVLEDAAEAHGATIDDRRVGALGDAAAFSFYGNKLLTTGEGGAITTNDAELARRIRFLKDHAMSADRRYWHPEVGFNYRMTNLQAALGCAQLERYEGMARRKTEILDQYRHELRDTGIQLNAIREDGASPVCWLVTALLPGRWTEQRQAELSATLKRDHAVDVRPFFVPIHQMPPYRGLRHHKRETSVADDLFVRGLCLPSSNKLTRADITRV
ncbi:MAG TPA: DegT/DnrJ/EryC1/StrS family aminotransferase, partial [Polyangiaceae bacterium]|nr:DegT/DnrJ/EryC1/StrS family aminotransferase [Polyangiaceae bacterium]